MKHTLQKGFVLLLVLLFLIVAPLNVAGQLFVSESSYTYEELTDGSLRLTESSLWNFPNGIVTVPSKINGKPVSVLGEGLFHHRNMNSVVIPEGITTIEKGAFIFCNELTTAYFPSTLQAIDEWAFDGTKLSCAVLPKTVTKIGQNAIGYLRIQDPASTNMLETVLVKNSRFIVYGYAGTAAETYAQENEMSFGDLSIYQKGDIVNRDETVNMEDCRKLYAAAGNESLDSLQRLLGDMNDDHAINTFDALICYLKVSGRA